jgi:hypothetical protein
MTPTQKLLQLKNWLFNFEKNHQFARYKTIDQQFEFEIDGEVEKGKEVFLINPDGQVIKPEDGEYAIQGRVLDIAEGKINEVISGNRGIAATPEVNDKIKEEKMSTEQKFVTDALKDGTQVTISGDSVVAGADLRIVKDGEELAPPSGEIELKSGNIVTVDDTGKIIEVKKVEPTDKPDIEDVVEGKEAVPAELASADEVNNEGVVNIETIKGMMKEIMEAVGELKTKMGEIENKQTKMGDEFATFKKEPAASPLKRNATNNHSFSDATDSRVRMIEMMRGNLK